MTDLIEKVADRLCDELAVESFENGDFQIEPTSIDIAAKAAIATILREMMEPTNDVLKVGMIAAANNSRMQQSLYETEEHRLRAMLRTFAQHHNINLGGEDGRS